MALQIVAFFGVQMYAKYSRYAIITIPTIK